jgi:hypothetical protein
MKRAGLKKKVSHEIRIVPRFHHFQNVRAALIRVWSDWQDRMIATSELMQFGGEG